MTKTSAFRSVDFTQSGWRQITTGTTTTVTSADAFGVIAIGAGSDFSVQIPSNNFPAGFQTVIARLNTTNVFIQAGFNSGVVLRVTTGVNATTPRLASQNSVASIIYSGNPTTGWLVFGDLV